MKITYRHGPNGPQYYMLNEPDDIVPVMVEYHYDAKKDFKLTIQCDMHGTTPCEHMKAVEHFRSQEAREFLIDHGIPVKP